MSLAIDPEKVRQVLLADGWHVVADQTFYLDSYEFVEAGKDGFVQHGGGRSGVCATGFSFVEVEHSRVVCCGPLTAILAVKEEV